MAEKQYIERGALLDDLDAAMKNSGMGYVVGQTMKRYVKRVSAADVAPVVHAEWIFDFELDGSNFYKCSVCGRQEVLLATESTEEYFPYCHCGARMDGGKERK